MKKTKHRNLYNGDCTFLFITGSRLGENRPYTVEELHRFIDLFDKNGVAALDRETIMCGFRSPWCRRNSSPRFHSRQDQDPRGRENIAMEQLVVYHRTATTS
jgi:hypothetical protein